MKNFEFAKAIRLRKRSEFINTATNGRKAQNRYFIAYFIPNRQPTSRLGITTTKRVGKAVTRNKIKRRAREYFRMNRVHLDLGLDINIIAKKEAADLTTEEIFFSLDNLFHKIKRDCAP